MSSVFLPPENTRLITVIAHVDHGKTSLADNLIESNGIISERLAGTLRYLDSTEEEQRRGITMRASAISLKHKYHPPKAAQNSEPVDTIISLFDSPGHSDFSAEVSSSLQCCDGALVVVDAVEGMCARTHQVLREAHSHQLFPILVINKLDRLCTELCLSPTEAYLRLRNLIESVNATCSAMLVSKHAESEDPQQDHKEEESSSARSRSKSAAMDDEENVWTFDPMKGNVIFASALYGWGFSVPALARSLFRQKILPLKPMMLKQYLFGDFKYKDGKVLKWKDEKSGEPLFATYGLQPLWDIYEGVASAAGASGAGSKLFMDGRIMNSTVNNNTEAKVAKIKADTPGMDQALGAMQVGGLSVHPLPTTPDELQNILNRTGSSNEDEILRSTLRRFRPLSDVILDTIYEQVPDPSIASSTVRPRALAFREDEESATNEEFQKIQSAVKTCDHSQDAPTVAHICKFMSTDRHHIRDPDLDESQETHIMGLARVLSGRLKTGGEYYVMGPKHKFGGTQPKKEIRLYLPMGQDFVRVKEVPAGHLCAIQNLEDVQLKTATICSSPNGMPLLGFERGIRPLVKVNVESVDPADTYALERGLVKLSLADAAVEVTATAKGERILACLGEIHLEQSIIDLKKVYCGKDIEMRISEPIVEFGETSDWFENEMDYQGFFASSAPPLRQATIPPYNEEEGIEHAKHGRSRTVLSGRHAAISLRTIPLTQTVYASLREGSLRDGSEEELEKVGKALGMNIGGTVDAQSVLEALRKSLNSMDENGNAIVESPSLTSGATVKGILSESGEVYVPKPAESSQEENVNDDERVDKDPSPESQSEQGLVEYDCSRKEIQRLGFNSSQNSQDGPVTNNNLDASALRIWNDQMKGSVVAGFQLAVRAGPICEEPVRGIMIVLEAAEIALKGGETDEQYVCAKPLAGGMVVAALREGIRCALL